MSVKVLSKGAVPPDSLDRIHMERKRERDNPFAEPSLTYLFESPVKELSLQVSLMESLNRER
jgi:hypothetical protein